MLVKEKAFDSLILQLVTEEIQTGDKLLFAKHLISKEMNTLSK